MYCVKNITRCAFCRAVVDRHDVEKHIAEKRGSPALRMDAVKDGDVQRLKSMVEHGQQLEEPNEEDNSNTLAHYAVLFNQKKVLDYLLMQ